MNLKGYNKFVNLRKWFMEKLDKVDMCDCHKSYEGTFSLHLDYQNYFEYDGECEPDYVAIELHCYVLGPGRHYKWTGKTIEDAVNKAKKEIESWVD